MKIEERNYGLKRTRPKPVVFNNEQLNLLVILTPWGEDTMSSIIFQELERFMMASQNDMEITSPFEFNTSLSRDCNYLRISTMLVNEIIYKSENNGDIKCCYEVLILYKNKNSISYLQIGCPHVLALEEALVPICFSQPAITSMDKNFFLLPAQVFGVDRNCHFQLGSFNVSNIKKLLLFSDRKLSPDIWSMNPAELTSNNIMKRQIQQNPEGAFWVGIVSL